MKLIIQGIRGIPAKHGGFETFAENLAIYLSNKGWDITVYCQEEMPSSSVPWESSWNNVRLIHIPVSGNGALSTIKFDYLSIRDALKREGIVLTLGYNTALFNIAFMLTRRKNVINMDGIEWKRDKWKFHERIWLFLNERAGCFFGNKLIADHPEISRHLESIAAKKKIATIPYGARDVFDADVSFLHKFGLTPKNYAILIARPEPENSILEIVRAFSSEKRNIKLVVLGKYDLTNSYHQQVISTASEDVLFVGPIYEHSILDSLRFYSKLYLHGHTVGGTNPSLVEALGAGQPVLAHDNRFNRWVAGGENCFFKDERDCGIILTKLLSDSEKLNRMADSSKKRFYEKFTWDCILSQYEKILLQQGLDS